MYANKKQHFIDKNYNVSNESYTCIYMNLITGTSRYFEIWI